MKKLQLRLLLFLFVAGLVSACGKYDEGPNLSFRSKNERVQNTWDVEFVYDNEADVTARYVDFELQILEDGSIVITNKDVNDSTTTQNGFWTFIDDKCGLRFDYSVPAVLPDRDYFTILRLKEKEMWLQQSFGDTLVRDWRFVEKEGAE